MADRLTDAEVEVLDELSDYEPGMRKERLQDFGLGTYLRCLEEDIDSVEGSNLILQPGATVDPEPNDVVILDLAGARTVNLPGIPNDSASITIKEAAGSSSPITVNTSGADVFEDGSTSFVTSSPFAAFTFRYLQGIWYVF